MIVPSKIKVGFQERNDTYTGQLGYVIYYDDKGILRKETSWNSWRSKKIEPQEFDNIPIEGFVVNKGNTGKCYSHYDRNPFIRIYDPRNFEFEITLGNLMLIMNYCSFEKGKAISGKFSYAWNGTSLWLLPVESDEYKQAYAEFKREKQTFKPKDLRPGMVLMKKSVRGSKRESFVYLGYLETSKYNISNYSIRYYGKILPKKEKGHLFVSNDPNSYYEGFQHIKPSAFDEFIGEVNIDEYLDRYKKEYCYEFKNLEFIPHQSTDNYYKNIIYIDSKTIILLDYYVPSIKIKMTDNGFEHEVIPTKDRKEIEIYPKYYRIDIVDKTTGYTVENI